MQLYIHYRFKSDYPADLADFEMVLEKDLKRANNEKRFAKDKKFWDDQLDALGEPLYSDIQGPEHNRPAAARCPLIMSRPSGNKVLYRNIFLPIIKIKSSGTTSWTL